MTTVKPISDNMMILSGRMLDKNTIQYLEHSQIKTCHAPIGEFGDFAAIYKKEGSGFAFVCAKPLTYNSFSIEGNTYITFSQYDITQVKKKADGRFLIILRGGKAVLETGYFEKNAPFLFEVVETCRNESLQTDQHICTQII